MDLSQNRFTEQTMEENPPGQSYDTDWKAIVRRHISLEKVRLYRHATPAGELAVIECLDDGDFAPVLIGMTNRPATRPVPDSQGASFIKNHPGGPVMILSRKFYSGVAPDVFGLDEADWREKSLLIRREHESAHYMTMRYYHSAKNELHDELIADFMGLTAAFGEYDPGKFLAFMDRRGGIYMSDEDRQAVQEQLKLALDNVAARYCEVADREKMFHILCRTSMAEMARGEFR